LLREVFVTLGILSDPAGVVVWSKDDVDEWRRFLADTDFKAACIPNESPPRF
jgi:hypothetical protein